MTALAAALVGAQAAEVRAHLGGLSYSDVTVRTDSVGYRLKFAAHLIPGLERTSKPSRSEVVRAESDILGWLGRTIVVRAGNAPCKPSIDELVGPDNNDDLTVLLGFEGPGPTKPLRIEFHPFDETLPDYRNIVSVRTENESLGFVFTRETPLLEVGRETGTTSAGAGERFREFFTLGVEHIWSGYDHLLFLLALLLPGGSFARIAGIVTAFTIAHSITLALATTGLVQVAAAPVEIAIAASIAFAAASVLRETGVDRRWALTFVFGLVHGFGFAGVLRESGLPPGGVALPLLAFNVGVEAGQLVVVAIAVQLLRMLGAGDVSRRIRRALAWATLAIGMFWTAARAAGVLGL
jgi:hypothetical protein